MVTPLPLWIDNGNGPVQNPDLTQDEFNEGLAVFVAQNIQALWQAATDYESAQICGSAIGLVTLGTVKGLPKSLAVLAWIQSIWTLYYQRKPQVTYQWDSALMDFSSCGPIPFTIPDLIAEVMTSSAGKV